MRAFTITWGEHSWSDAEVVSAHLITVADILETPTFDVEPWAGVKQLAAWVVTFLALDRVRTGVGTAEAIVEATREVYAAPPDKLLLALRPRLAVLPDGAPVDVAS